MDYLQYQIRGLKDMVFFGLSFKPYYKWITFNTLKGEDLYVYSNRF